jgi:hypothetical protein
MAEFGARTLNAEAILRLVDKTQEGLRSAEKNLTQFEKRMQTAAKRMAVVGGALTLAVTAPVIGFFKEGVSDALEEDKALRRIEQTVTNVGRKMGISFEHMKALAERLSDNTESVSTFGEVMEKNIGVLLKFGNIHGKTFDRAVQVAEDASAALAQPMDAMADVIGRSLNAPLQGMRQLRTLGVAFSAEEQKRIKMLVNSRQLARAQLVILGALERKYHDAARAFAKTDAGRMEQVTKNFKEFRQNIGFTLLPILEPFIEKMRQLTDSLKKMSPEQQKLIVGLGAVAAAAGPVLVTAGLIVGALTKLRPIFGFLIRRLPLLLALSSLIESVGRKWGVVTTAASGARDAIVAAVTAAQQGKYGEAARQTGKAFTDLYKLQDEVFNDMLAHIPLVGPALASADKAVTQWLDSMIGKFFAWGNAIVGAVERAIAAVNKFTGLSPVVGQHHPGKGYSGPNYQRQKAMETERRFMTPDPIPGLEGRAAGGRVEARQRVIVGERGLEIFQPDVGGTIIPNQAAREQLRVARGLPADVLDAIASYKSRAAVAKYPEERRFMTPDPIPGLEGRAAGGRVEARQRVVVGERTIIPNQAAREQLERQGRVARGLPADVLDAIASYKSRAAVAKYPEERRFMTPDPIPGLEGRAAGGRVEARQRVVVGERGLEIFQPDVAGTIIPNQAAREQLRVPRGLPADVLDAIASYKSRAAVAKYPEAVLIDLLDKLRTERVGRGLNPADRADVIRALRESFNVSGGPAVRKQDAARENLGPRDPKRPEARALASREPEPPRRLAGGRVAGGQTVTVGEGGVERFRPDAPGTIEPNSAVRAASNRADRVAKSLERVSYNLESLTGLLRQVLLRGSGGGGAGLSGGTGGGTGGGGEGGGTVSYGPGSGGLGYGGKVGGGGPGSVGSGLTYRGAGGRTVPIGHHPAMGPPPTQGPIPGSGPAQAAGTYRKPYALGPADLDPRVINTIAGEAIVKNPQSVDAVVNNMLNRVGTKHAWGPDQNMLQVARAPGQYAGYRRASEKEAAFIADRMRLVASGAVPDPTHGANTYRAAWYGSPQTSKWFRKYGQFGTVVGGNRFAYDPAGGRGPYSPFDEKTVAANLARQQRPGPQLDRTMKGEFGAGVQRNIETVSSQQRARQNLETIAASGDASAADRRGVNIGKGQLDVNLQITGQPATVKKLHVKHPENLQVMTGVDTTGSRNSRPGGLIGAI